MRASHGVIYLAALWLASPAQAQWVSGLPLGGGSISGDLSVGGALTVTGSISGADYKIGAANALSFPTFESGTAGDTLAIGRGALGGTAPSAAAYQNVAIGALTMSGNGITTAAVKNTAVGYNAMAALTTGTLNTCIGNGACDATTTGNNNTAVGGNALGAASINGGSVAIGNNAGGASTGGLGTFLGTNTGLLVSTGASNTIVGSSVASTVLTTGANNVLIGTNNSLTTAAAGTSNTIGIGAGSTAILAVTGAGTPTTSTTTINGQQVNPNLTTGTNADTVCMEAGGRLLIQAAACTISSMRFKNLIGGYKVGGALDTIRGLEPIVFTMKEGEKPNPDRNYGNTQVGLSAENVAAIEPRCAIYEEDGSTPKAYRQECLIAILVAAVQAQQQQIADLKERLR